MSQHNLKDIEQRLKELDEIEQVERRALVTYSDKRRACHKPKVYEFWRPEDDIKASLKVQEHIDKQEEEARLRRLSENPENWMEWDENEEDFVIVLYKPMPRTERAKLMQEREDAYHQWRERKRERDREKKELNARQFPSKYGFFYTVGYYKAYPKFGIKKSWVNRIKSKDADGEFVRKLEGDKEPFQSMYERWFWPPDWIAQGKPHMYFRTRGIYLDFPEIKKNPPKKGDSILPNAEEEPEKKELMTVGEAIAQMGGNPRRFKGGKHLLDLLGEEEFERGHCWFDFYYDDVMGLFYRKKLGSDAEYFFDPTCGVWRLKRPAWRGHNRQTPYDYYYDLNTKEFYPREWYRGPSEWFYDEEYNVWKLKDQVFGFSPNKSEYLRFPLWRRGKVKPIFKDHVSLRKKRTKKRKSRVVKNASRRSLGPENKSEKERQRKLEARKKYDNEREREIENHEIPGYYFDETRGKWILKSSAAPEAQNKIEFYENGKRWILRGQNREIEWRGMTGYCPDDYYYNPFEGKFYTKPPRQPDKFLYNTSNGAWMRREHIDNDKLGKNMMHAHRYFWDHISGSYEPKIHQEFILQPFKEMNDIEHPYVLRKYPNIWYHGPTPRSGLQPGDFYWDQDQHTWLPKKYRMDQLHNPEDKVVPRGQAFTKESLLNEFSDEERNQFYWDIEEGDFLKMLPNKEYYKDEDDGLMKSVELREMENRVKGQENTTAPNKFYWDDAQGTMMEKSGSDDNYEYDEEFGVYRRKFRFARTHPSKLTPVDFFWDDFEGKFKLKAKGDEDYYLFDDKTLLYRRKFAVGITKTGLSPQDYVWQPLAGRYVRKVAKRGNIEQHPIDWRPPYRNYEKNWQVDQQ